MNKSEILQLIFDVNDLELLSRNSPGSLQLRKKVEGFYLRYPKLIEVREINSVCGVGGGPRCAGVLHRLRHRLANEVVVAQSVDPALELRLACAVKAQECTLGGCRDTLRVRIQEVQGAIIDFLFDERNKVSLRKSLESLIRIL
ncbi:MAG: hypothetical protein S4CHLAM102_14710 [Chlamydiia bacterium]|nr:hypothetical protein [Chlamydiia bacterium]